MGAIKSTEKRTPDFFFRPVIKLSKSKSPLLVCSLLKIWDTQKKKNQLSKNEKPFCWQKNKLVAIEAKKKLFNYL